MNGSTDNWAKRHVVETVAIVLAGVAFVVVAAVLASVLAKRRKASMDVDVVALWVDGSDAAWRRQLAEHLPLERERARRAGVKLRHEPEREPQAVVEGARDELYYGARSIVKFMPWVRRYFLVTQRPHKPHWWPASGRVGKTRFVLVHHDQIVKDSEALPLFNSLAIQKHVHNIPGLAEHFVLFDDDMLVGQPLEKSAFFDAAGNPVVRTEKYVGVGNSIWSSICKNNLNHVLSKVPGLAESAVVFPAHVAYPLLKSAMKQVANTTLGNDFRFRSDQDYVIHWVVLGVLHAEGRVTALPEHVRTPYLFRGQLLKHANDLPHLMCLEQPGRADFDVLDKHFSDHEDERA